MNACARWARTVIESGAELRRADDGTVAILDDSKLPDDLRRLFAVAPDSMALVAAELDRCRVESADGSSDNTSPDRAFLLLLPYGRCWLVTTPRALRLIAPEANRRGEPVVTIEELFALTRHGWSLTLLGRRIFPTPKTQEA